MFDNHVSANQNNDTSTNPASPHLNHILDDDHVVFQSTKVFIYEGDHHDISNKESLPYKLVRNLGHGASASVEMVEDMNTRSVYARKIFRNVYSRNLEDTKRKFYDEIRIMRRLAPHHHIIRVFATYIAQRELGLILDPVADGGDLANFLEDFRDSKDAGVDDPKKRDILYSAFGCLANGLEFIHRQTIRHRDIKPQNILIHRGSVIFTDFGISLDFSQVGHSTTTGNPQAFTRRYCAPEVIDWGGRNSKSDVFSLGCVFLEIISTLGLAIIPNHIFDGCYYQYIEDILICLSSNPFSLISTITSRMLRNNPNERTCAKDLVSQLLGFPHYFCTTCKELLSKPETSNSQNLELKPSESLSSLSSKAKYTSNANNAAVSVSVHEIGATSPHIQDRWGRTRAMNRRRLEKIHPKLQTMWKTLEAVPVLEVQKAEQPTAITRKLKSFQLEGLSWMTRQEKTQYKGGLLGDEMGMGKTIQAVFLIMSDYPAKDPTLVVVHPVALMQWLNEIREYTDGKLNVLVYHGQNSKVKNMTVKELKKHNVIIVSYNSLESLYRKETKGWSRGEYIIMEVSPLHAIKYHRLILDEAYSIKQRTTGISKACFALKGSYKWYLSGTSVQNRIREFFSLLRFLEVRPFADYFCVSCDCEQPRLKLDDDHICVDCEHSGAEHMSVFNQELLNPITGDDPMRI